MEKFTKPAYIFDDALVVTLLQKNKITSNRDYMFFSKLCSLNLEVIPFEEALHLSEFSNNEQSFLSYLKRFEDKGLLIVRHEIRPGGIAPCYIRLCNEDSFAFSYEYINERFIQGTEDLSLPLPTFKDFMFNNITIFQEFVTEYKPGVLSSKLAKTLDTEAKIYSIPIYKDLLYCTDKNVELICDYIIKRVRAQLTSQSLLLQEILKVFNQKFIIFKERLESEDLKEWEVIVSTLFKNISQLRTNNRVKEYVEFLDYIIILNTIISGHVLYIEKRTKRDVNRENVKEAVNREMLRLSNGISKGNFRAFIQKLAVEHALNEEDRVYEHVYARLVISCKDVKNDNYAGIIDFENYLIHSSLLANYIAEKYLYLNEKLNKYYADIMYNFLIHKLPAKDAVFFDTQELEVSVRQQVFQLDEFMYSILRNPVVLAHIIIVTTQRMNLSMKTTEPEQGPEPPLEPGLVTTKGTRATSSDQYNQLSVSKKLSAFFNLRTKQLLAWHEIFNIDTVSLAQLSFARLNLFRKILLFFSNRYKYTLKKIKTINMTYKKDLLDAEKRDLLK